MHLRSLLLVLALATSLLAFSLRPQLHKYREFFTIVEKKKTATASDLASLVLALLAKLLKGSSAVWLNLLQGQVEVMDLGALVPVDLLTFALGRPVRREDLHWWDRLAEDLLAAMDYFNKIVVDKGWVT